MVQEKDKRKESAARLPSPCQLLLRIPVHAETELPITNPFSPPVHYRTIVPTTFTTHLRLQLLVHLQVAVSQDKPREGVQLVADQHSSGAPRDLQHAEPVAVEVRRGNLRRRIVDQVVAVLAHELPSGDSPMEFHGDPFAAFDGATDELVGAPFATLTFYKIGRNQLILSWTTMVIGRGTIHLRCSMRPIDIGHIGFWRLLAENASAARNQLAKIVKRYGPDWDEERWLELRLCPVLLRLVVARDELRISFQDLKQQAAL